MTRRRMGRLAVVVASIAMAASACSVPGVGVRGSGDVVTESRSVSGIEAIALSGSGTVTVEATGTESLTIEAEDNIMEFLTSDVNGGTLHLGARGIVSPTREIRYTVTVVALDGLSISGSGDISTIGPTKGDLTTDISGSGRIEVGDLDGGTVTVDISGSGSVALTGGAEHLGVSISGSGDLDAAAFPVATADISVSGSGDASVNVTDDLRADISGSGNIDYLGDPAIEVDIGGSGSIGHG